ncbi:MAG: AraC family transcriptional regulator [Spirochaetales bacterium]|nr:AraC family transcriptional regulator [Spirochaetales bacterium]
MPLFKDNWFFHMESAPRRFPGGREVQAAGYMARKRERMNKTFDTLNFSLILSGQGFYELKGKRLPVKAPMMITQSPGQPVHYGPEGEWEELFIIYNAGYESYFRDRKILESPLWPVWRLSEIKSLLLDQFHHTQKQLDRENLCDLYDRMDLTLEKVIIDSRQEPHLPGETHLQLFVQNLYKRIETDCGGSYDFHRLASEAGFSASSFRRCWEDMYSTPPGQSLIEMRMQRACRYLAETDMPVKEIAWNLGYEDPLYFSRLFRKKRDESPGSYRKRTRAPFVT